jgi:hypothetical protein
MDLPSIRAMADLATPMSIRVAATLSLVERAGSAGATAEQLASETGTATPAIRCLLDHLVTIGVFDLDMESSRYRPTNLGAQLSEDASEGIKPLLDINSAGGRAELAFVELLGTITTGAPAYVHRYGRDFWADLDTRPELRRSFDAQMNWRFRVQAPQIAQHWDWSRFSEILDVGGGDGTVLAASCTPIPTFADGSWIWPRRLPLLPTDSRRPDSVIGPALFPAASSTPCPWGPTPMFCPTSCTTGTTSTLARSWPGVVRPPHRTARWW